MELSIFALLVALGSAYFASQNTALVNIRLASYQWDNIPLSAVVLGAMLLGLLLAYIFYLLQNLSDYFSSQKRERKITEAQKTITSLAKQVHDLENENAGLKEVAGQPASSRTEI